MRLKAMVSAVAVSAVLLGGIAQAMSDHDGGRGPRGSHGRGDPSNGGTQDDDGGPHDGAKPGGGNDDQKGPHGRADGGKTDDGSPGDATNPGGSDPGNQKGSHGRGHGPRTCDDAAVAAAQQAIDAACPCAGPSDTRPWKNHGRYVRCVAHATRDAIQDAAGSLTRRCLRTAVRCAATSTCGKPNLVACRKVTTDTCVAGACNLDPGRECATDDDCTERSCSITTAARCSGTAGTGSCCSASPNGAFLDGDEE